MNWIKQASGTAFSYFLVIDKYFYYTFGDLQIKQNADGMGISGVCASEFDFSVAYDEYAAKTPESGAMVMFGIDGSKTAYCYYISQRSRSGGKVTFKCLDRTLMLGVSSDMIDIPYTDVTEDDEDSGEITTLELVKTIAKYAGFAGCTSSLIEKVGSFSWLKMKKSDIRGKTARSLLETISAAWCGYFTVSANDYLDFVFFGKMVHSLCPIETHSAIAMRSERSRITRVRACKGSEYYYSGDDNADVFSTLTVQTEFASQEYADALLLRVKDYTYRSWECSKAIVDAAKLIDGYLPTISTEMNKYHVPDGVDTLTEFTANSLTLNFTSTGIYASLSSNEVTEDEYAYLGYFSRKLEEKLSDGEKLGNDTLITRYQGVVHLGEKKKDESTGKITQNRYGYSKATADGVVEFSGALVSKVTPKSARWESERVALIDYGGKKYKYTIERDSNGNVTSFEKEELKEGSQ